MNSQRVEDGTNIDLSSFICLVLATHLLYARFVLHFLYLREQKNVLRQPNPLK